MEPRYERNIPALTEAEASLLREKRVLIVGCGGLGGHIIDQLARIGVGHLRIVDGDVFEVSNLNRQLFSQLPLLGVSKAMAAADHLRRVNPDVTADIVDTFMTRENLPSLISGCDIVMDALDNIPDRRLLLSACSSAGIPYVYGAVQGWVAQAGVFMPEDAWADALFSEGTGPGDKSVLSFTPALCASVQCALCIRLLTGHPVKTGTLFHFDLLNQEFDSISLG